MKGKWGEIESGGNAVMPAGLLSHRQYLHYVLRRRIVRTYVKNFRPKESFATLFVLWEIF